MDYLFILAGFLLLFGGGESLVRGAVGISRRFGVSPLLIGMTVVAFATSAPELVVSVSAALRGNADLAVGNVVGSNIANVALILGLAGLIRAVRVDRLEIRRDALVMFASMITLWLLGLTGRIGRIEGVVFVLGLIAYIVLSYRAEVRAGTAATDWHVAEEEELEEEIEPTPNLVISGSLVTLGLAALVIGANLLVIGASNVAEAFGVPQTVIGLTIVAIGTSLPELATSIVASIRGHDEVAVGNVVGSNIFNTLLIIGATATLVPLPVAENVARVDMPVMLVVAGIGVGALLVQGRLGRLISLGLLATYVVYVGLLYGVR